MSDPTVTAFLTKLLCSHGGRLPRSQLTDLLELSPEQIEQILRDEAQRFPQVGELVLAQSPLRICPRYLKSEEEEPGCDRLHLCRYYLQGKCWKGKRPQCKFFHDILSDHNQTVLKANEVSGLNDEELKVLLVQNDSQLLPEICMKYIYDKCDQGKGCTRLHVCGFFTRGECNRRVCKRSHHLLDSSPDLLLNRCRLPMETVQNFQMLCSLKHNLRLQALREESRGEAGGGAPRGRGRGTGFRFRWRSGSRPPSESGESQQCGSGKEDEDDADCDGRQESRKEMGRGSSTAPRGRGRRRERYRKNGARDNLQNRSQDRQKAGTGSHFRGRSGSRPPSVSGESQHCGSGEADEEDDDDCGDGHQESRRETGEWASMAPRGRGRGQPGDRMRNEDYVGYSNGNQGIDAEKIKEVLFLFDKPHSGNTRVGSSVQSSAAKPPEKAEGAQSRPTLSPTTPSTFTQIMDLYQSPVQVTAASSNTPKVAPVISNITLPNEARSRVAPIPSAVSNQATRAPTFNPIASHPKPLMGSSEPVSYYSTVIPSNVPPPSSGMLNTNVTSSAPGPSSFSGMDFAKLYISVNSPTYGPQPTPLAGCSKPVIPAAQPKPNTLYYKPVNSPSVDPFKVPSTPSPSARLTTYSPIQGPSTPQQKLMAEYNAPVSSSSLGSSNVSPAAVRERGGRGQPGDRMRNEDYVGYSNGNQGIDAEKIMEVLFFSNKPHSGNTRVGSSVQSSAAKPPEKAEGAQSRPPLFPTTPSTFTQIMDLYQSPVQVTAASSNTPKVAPVISNITLPNEARSRVAPIPSAVSNQATRAPIVNPIASHPKPLMRSSEPVSYSTVRPSNVPPPSSAGPAADPDICLPNVWKYCKLGNKCPDMHFYLPYRWQVFDGKNWDDSPNMENVEKAYCDPKVSRIPLVDFETMKSGSNRVRRLSTLSSVTKPEFVLTTEWIWYWKDEHGTWIQYGQSNTKNVSATILSSDMENVYLSGPTGTIPFTAAQQRYEINFRVMRQRNIMYQTEKEVRRRPKFLSFEEVKMLKGSTKSAVANSPLRSIASALNAGIYPKEWDPEAMPDIGHKKVIVPETSSEFSNIVTMFTKTLSGQKVKKVWRIQNPSVWQIYQWQNEQMKKVNRGNNVEERQLFHGTDSTHLPAICDQNFDWRICGTHGTVYGQGSYFARDASYSHNYSTPTSSGQRTMFVARVLVGDFVQGDPNMKRPPQKTLSTQCYDSCVDNIHNPSIFVVFDKLQIYPEYVLEYEEEKKSCAIC